MSGTDPEMLPTVLFQALRTWDCGISALEERDRKAQMMQLLVFESSLPPATASLLSVNT